MKNENLFEMWDEMGISLSTNSKLSKAMIESYITPKIKKLNSALSINAIVNIATSLTCIGLLSINTYIYKANNVMLGIQVSLLALSIIFFVYGIFIITKLREINSFTKDIAELIALKIKFVKVHYEYWVIVIALTVSILVFSVNSLIGNNTGTYQINNPQMYVVIHLAIFAFIYLINKNTTAQSVGQLKGYLTDIQNQTMDYSSTNEQKIQRYRLYYILFFAVVTVVLLLGIYLSYRGA